MNIESSSAKEKFAERIATIAIKKIALVFILPSPIFKLI